MSDGLIGSEVLPATGQSRKSITLVVTVLVLFGLTFLTER